MTEPGPISASLEAELMLGLEDLEDDVGMIREVALGLPRAGGSTSPSATRSPS